MTSLSSTRPGFTLVELVIVVMILGILAGVATPKLLNTSATAAQNAFATQLLAFADGFDLYMVKNGQHPNNAATGTLPPGVEEFLNAKDFAADTPLGGKWDYLAGSGGSNASVGVEYLNGTDYPGDTIMTAVDELIDDGVLTTGAFKVLGSTTKWGYLKIGE